ncbi:MAG: DUF1028 domain-containing protein [Saprospiraceae bacterium]
MKKLILLSFLFSLSINIFSQDTFSIIAVDSITGEIGAAGATCVDDIGQLGGVQLLNKIIPGKGGVNAQASICINPHINLDNAITQMEEGLSPQEIIDWLVANDACFASNFNPENRQYGIVDFDTNGSPRIAAFTGTNTDDYKGHRTGANYSIQGNILLGAEVLDGMENGFNNTTGSLAQKLMAAMQGANMPGADQRCLARGTSSTSAFLRIYKPTDDVNDPYLELNIPEIFPVGLEPIDSLQNLFTTWENTTSTESVFGKNKIKINLFPNPVSELLQVSLKSDTDLVLALSIFNTVGKNMIEKSISISKNWNDKIEVKHFPNGLYYLRIASKDGSSKTLKFLKN